MSISAFGPSPLRPQVLPAPIRETRYLALEAYKNPTPNIPSKPLPVAPTPETQVPPSRQIEVLNLHGEVTGTRINTTA